jgi:hypothetical protein
MTLYISTVNSHPIIRFLKVIMADSYLLPSKPAEDAFRTDDT